MVKFPETFGNPAFADGNSQNATWIINPLNLTTVATGEP